VKVICDFSMVPAEAGWLRVWFNVWEPSSGAVEATAATLRASIGLFLDRTRPRMRARRFHR
jgi:ABC-type cobalt transport system substrate-binding protein